MLLKDVKTNKDSRLCPIDRDHPPDSGGFLDCNYPQAGPDRCIDLINDLTTLNFTLTLIFSLIKFDMFDLFHDIGRQYRIIRYISSFP